MAGLFFVAVRFLLRIKKAPFFFGNALIDDHVSTPIQYNILALVGAVPERIHPIRFGIIPAFLATLKQFRLVTENAVRICSDPYATYSLLEAFSEMLYWQLFFKKRSIDSILVVNDFSPNRLSMIHTALQQNVRVHIYMMSTHVPGIIPPFIVDTFFCWNEKQYQTLKAFCNHCVIIPHTEAQIQTHQLRGGELNIGILLNRYYNVEPTAALITELSKDSNRTVEVRLHPGAEQTSENLTISNRITKRQEPLNAFCSRQDLVIVGNSSSAKEALFMGIPVVYCPRLDNVIYDTYRYIEDGIVPELQGFNLDLDQIIDFYETRSKERTVSPETEREFTKYIEAIFQ
jgi:hypothetical protein